MHRRENNTYSIKALPLSNSVSTRSQSINHVIKESRALELLQSFILFFKYLGRFKLSEGLHFQALFLPKFIASNITGHLSIS